MTTFRLGLQRFKSGQEGSVAIIFALLATSLFGFLALAIDVARVHSLANKVSAALDAAALAGAKALDKGADDNEIKTVAKAYFDAQMASLQIHGVVFSAFDADVTRQHSVVKTSVEAAMGTTFGRIVGMDNIDVKRTASVVYKTRNVELAMALDITGSMADGTKLSDMKSAAVDVIDTLLSESPSEAAVRIALVPWSNSVNAGMFSDAVSNNASVDGCVTERVGSDAASDRYPSGSAALPAVTAAPVGSYYGCPGTYIMPLAGRSKQTDLKSAVNAFMPEGWTAGHIGTAWGWYMVSPAWSGIWPSASRPAPYAPNDTVKSVLLMTDGEFNTSFATGLLTDPTLMMDESYNQFQALCTAMKLEKVVVYTVGFGLINARGMTALQSCASGSAQFFQAATGADLKVAFREIATQLKSMRIQR